MCAFSATQITFVIKPWTGNLPYITEGQLWHHCASVNDSHYYVTYEIAIWDSICYPMLSTNDLWIISNASLHVDC